MTASLTEQGKPRMAREISDCNVMATFAQGASGMVSVGRKAVALVKPRYS